MWGGKCLEEGKGAEEGSTETGEAKLKDGGARGSSEGGGSGGLGCVGGRGRAGGGGGHSSGCREARVCGLGVLSVEGPSLSNCERKVRIGRFGYGECG